MSTETDNFDYMQLEINNVLDLQTSIEEDEIYGIISENDGGIIAYALGRDHAESIIEALNAANIVYEMAMKSRAT